MEPHDDIKPFTTDGCSGGMSATWRWLFNQPPPWEDYCVTHDEAYWQGGTKEQRAFADARLRVAVAQSGHPVIALLMWLSVRLGGHPLLPFSWRWGYGYDWPRPYTKV